MTLSTFDELTLNLNETVLEALGTSAIFKPVAGGSTSCYVEFDKSVEMLPDSFSGQVAAWAYYVSVSIEKLGATPARGDLFEIASTDYTVMETERDQTDRDWLKMKVKE